ncbi:MAG: hypothetical protein LBK52_01755 [Deltaproteobacteria bacterium]|nr:hypothetical protein [Deltaproteobacteria bacterium]
MMKQTASLLLIFLWLGLLGSGCGISPADSASLSRGQSVDFSRRDFVRIASPCVLIPQRGLVVTAIDGKPSRPYTLPDSSIVFLEPGRHKLTFFVRTGISASSGSSASAGPVSVSTSYTSSGNMEGLEHDVNIAENTNYILNYKLYWTKNPEYGLVEISDPADKARAEKALQEFPAFQERMAAEARAAEASSADYLAFSRQNPRLLEGRWKSAEGKELIIQGDNVTLKMLPLLGTAPTRDGKFFYDQSTISILWDIPGKQRSSSGPDDVVIYKISGNTLDLNTGDMLSKFHYLHGLYQRIP